MENELIEKKLNTEEIFDGIVLHVQRDTVSLPNGKEAIREVIRHMGAVCVAPLTDEGELIVERQYRYAVGQVMTEIPAGKLDYAGEDRLAAAQRELKEETGYIAERWTDIGLYYPAPAYSDEKITMYLAEGLHAGERHLDEGEFLDVVKVPVAELVSDVVNGIITDSKTQIAVLKVAEILRRREEKQSDHLRNEPETLKQDPQSVSTEEISAAQSDPMKTTSKIMNASSAAASSFAILSVEKDGVETFGAPVKENKAAVSEQVTGAPDQKVQARKDAAQTNESYTAQKQSIFDRMRSKTDIDKAKKIFLACVLIGIIILLVGGVVNIPIIALIGLLVLAYGVATDLICCRCPHCGKYLNKRASGRECPFCHQYLRPDGKPGK